MKACWRGFLLSGFALGLLSPAHGHQELHHNITLDLRQLEQEGSIRLTFTLHAPELVVGLEEAASALYDRNWLAQQSPQELRRLMSLGRSYLAARFKLGIDDREPIELSRRVSFENPDAIRGGGARELSPGCLEASLLLSPDETAGKLRIDHAANSNKRLLLVIERTGAFPEVEDIPPGAHALIPLSREGSERAAPPPASLTDSPPATRWVVPLAGTLVLLGSAALVFTKRRSPSPASPAS